MTGAIVLDKGMAPIVPSRAGIITGLSAREGQLVRAGEPLVRVRAEEDMATGNTAPRRIMEAVSEQDRRLASQSDLMLRSASTEQGRLATQVAGLSEEIAHLNEQIEVQRRLVAVAESEFREVQNVAGRGFISRRDVNVREAALLTRRQQLSQLEQALTTKLSDLGQIRRAVVQAGTAAQAQAAGILSSRAELSQVRAQAEAAQGYVLNSPIDGIATAVTARIGQPISASQSLMVVMPRDARARAEMLVPTSAAACLAQGQEVRLAVDAFPYQRFGTIRARIIEISTTAIPRQTADGGTVPVYLVTAELDQPWVMAFGRRQALLPGMTLTARIVTEKRSLIEWLFEPLFAIGNR